MHFVLFELMLCAYYWYFSSWKEVHNKKNRLSRQKHNNST